MAEPVPFRVAGSGDTTDAPSGAVPIDLYGAGGSGGDAVESVNGQTGEVEVNWGNLPDKPATFPPTVGTTATTAKAGDYVPEWGDVTGKPTTFPPVVGTGATDAKAGNYQPTWAQVTAKPATVDALPATLGTAGQVLAVNAEGTGLEWIDPA